MEASLARSYCMLEIERHQLALDGIRFNAAGASAVDEGLFVDDLALGLLTGNACGTALVCIEVHQGEPPAEPEEHWDETAEIPVITTEQVSVRGAIPRVTVQRRTEGGRHRLRAHSRDRHVPFDLAVRGTSEIILIQLWP